MARWDANWYIQIAQQGYVFRPDGTGSVSFFPLFPLLLRGLIFCGVNPVVAGLLIANGCFLGALWLFYRLVKEEFGRRELARHATALLAFSPGLAWFSIGYTESLFLLLSIGLVYALRRRRFGIGAMLGVLAGLSRPNAVVLVAPLLLLVGPTIGESWRRSNWRRLCVVGSSAIAPIIGHGLYLGYLQLAFGNWRANHIVELHGWDTKFQLSWLVLSQKIPGVGLHLFDNPEVCREHVAWSWFLLLFVTLFSLIALWEKRAGWWQSVFVLAYFSLYVSILQLNGPVYAVARYAAPIFPFYIAVALFAENRCWAQPAALVACVMWSTITGLMLFAGYHIN